LHPTNTSMQARTAAGFTLIEVMIALVLLGIGMLAVGAAQLTSMRIASQAQHRSQALYLAEEQLEILQAMPRDDALFNAAATTQDPTNPIDLTAEVEDATTFSRQWTVTPNVPSAGLTTLRVQVTWNVDGVGQAVGDLQTVTLDGIKETQ